MIVPGLSSLCCATTAILELLAASPKRINLSFVFGAAAFDVPPIKICQS